MMKYILLALVLISSNAQSAVLCQSMSDARYQAWFEGYACPSGYFLIRVG